MVFASGIVFLLIGLLVLVGQLISTVNFPLAQRLGLQERAEGCDPLYSDLEHNTARWDLVVLWTLPLTGLLMVLDHGWWPYLALVAGGFYLDTGGREIAKLRGLGGHEVRMGGAKERRQTVGFLVVLAAVGLWAIGVAATMLIGSAEAL